MRTKPELRWEILQRIKALSISEKADLDVALSQHFLNYIRKQDFKKIHCYYPQNNEVNIRSCLETLRLEGYQIYLPKVIGKGLMSSHLFEGKTALVKSKWGIWEPKNQASDVEHFDLILVPGLAFTASFHRLGYGGGFYDRFLLKQSKAEKISLAYPFSLNQEFPVEEHDVAIDQILSINPSSASFFLAKE